jgi:hypothetical protein
LKQRAASDISLTVIPEAGVRLVSLTGLAGTPPAEGVNVPLPPLGTGSSAVILAQLQVDGSPATVSRSLVKVELRYFDEFVQQPVTMEQTITVEMAANLTGYDPTWDLEILRNVTIQRTAEGMREIDRLFQAGQYEAAWRLAVELEGQLDEVARLTNDSQMREDVNLMQRYQQTLADAVWQTEVRSPRLDEAPAAPENERPYRGPYRGNEGNPTPTPAVPTVEIR